MQRREAGSTENGATEELYPGRPVVNASPELTLELRLFNGLIWPLLYVSYIPMVVMPLILWGSVFREPRAPFPLFMLLAAVTVIPMAGLAFYDFVPGRYRRAHLVVGFSLYSSCYLAGNWLGLSGGRWYWLHLTMLSMLATTVLCLQGSGAMIKDRSRVKALKRGHWCIFWMFAILVEFRARRHTWMAIDYLWGIYFLWCAWRVSHMKGIEEDAR